MPKPDSSRKPAGYLIVVGDPSDGFLVYGDEAGNPWVDPALAIEYSSEEFRGETWWVVPIHPVYRDCPTTSREKDAFDEEDDEELNGG